MDNGRSKYAVKDNLVALLRESRPGSAQKGIVLSEERDV